MITATNNLLVIMRRHNIEWKELLAHQKASRNDLRYLHRLYKAEIFNQGKDYNYIAAIIQKQTFEIWELQIFNQEERILLREKHYREKNPF